VEFRLNLKPRRQHLEELRLAVGDAGIAAVGNPLTLITWRPAKFSGRCHFKTYCIGFALAQRLRVW
jgi:hypothetical protein